MAFTDVELAVLSYFSFYYFASSDVELDFYDYIQKHEKSLKINLGDEYHDAISSLVKKVSAGGYKLVLRENDKDNTGFAAFAIEDPDYNVTIVCRGTEGMPNTKNGKKDLKADLQLAYMNCTDQQAVMLDFVNKIVKKGYKGYSFTGHSLGGNLALFGAIMLDKPMLLNDCVTFNAPGFNKTFRKKYVSQITTIEHRVRNYVNECDGVSNAFFIPGEIIVVECKGWDGFHKDGFSAHYMDMFVIKNGMFKRNRSGLKDLTAVGMTLDAVTFVTDNTVRPKDADADSMKLKETSFA